MKPSWLMLLVVWIDYQYHVDTLVVIIVHICSDSTKFHALQNSCRSTGFISI